MLLTFQLCSFDVAIHRIQYWPQCTIPEWNSLPEAVATAPSLTSLESRVQRYFSNSFLLQVYSVYFSSVCLQYSARVVEGLVLCRSGSSPRECITNRISLVWDLKIILQGFFFISSDFILYYFIYLFIYFVSFNDSFSHCIPLCPQCELMQFLL